MPSDKDVEFFSYPENLNPEFARGWFDRFKPAAQGQIIGDVNAAYFWTETKSRWSTKLEGFNRKIPESVRDWLGQDVLLIVSIRNPVERAISAYLHHIHEGPVTPEQSLLGVQDPLGIVDMGFYGSHLRNWLESFAAEHFLVIDGLPGGHESAHSILGGTLAFLGLSDFDTWIGIDKTVFPGIERIVRPDGVWIPADHPRIAAHLPLRRAVSETTEGGRRFLRLVDGKELAELEEIYRADQALLFSQLDSGDISVVRAGAPDAAET